MTSAEPSDVPPAEGTRWYGWLCASGWRRWGCLLLFTLVTRLPLLTYPKACDDEQVYTVVAVQMLHGGLPYVDAVERKPPLLFYLYDGILRVFGERSYAALHVAAWLWTLASMAALDLVLRRRFGVSTAFAGALLYTLFMAWANYTNLALNGELLMNLPVLLAFAVVLRDSRSRARPELVAAGALVAIAFLLKQPAAVAGAPLLLYLLHPDYRARRGLGWVAACGQASLLLLGGAATLAAAAAYLWRQGILGEAWFWAIANHKNPLGPSTWFFWHKLPARGGLFLAETLPLLALVGLSLHQGLAAKGVWQRWRAEFAAFLAFLGVSCLGLAVNGQFNYHYFLQLMPPLALLAAPVLAGIWAGTLPVRWRPLAPAFLARWLGLLAVLFLVVDAIGLAQNRAPLPAAVYVRERSTADDRIFMWGQGTAQTGMYLDAQRRPATRYIASFPLNGLVFGMYDEHYDTRDRIVPGAWDNLRREFALHPPKFIIDCHEARDGRLHKIRDHAYLRELLASEFHEVYRGADAIVYQRWPIVTAQPH